MSRRSRRRLRQSRALRAQTKGAAPRAGARLKGPGARQSAAAAQRPWERALRFALFGVLGLLLLTPFVATPGTVFPFVVGKALWSRSLIGVAFALWAVLALTRPGYRPPRSWLLALLGAGLGVSLLSAAFGVSLQYSLWSDYERMLGVIDRAHWCALAVVLASVLRTGRAWRALLGANVAAGTAVACIVIARALDIEVPHFGAFPEPDGRRLGGPFGNPTFLSVYLLANGVLGAGFAARAWAASTSLGWMGATALHFYALVLAGSAGGFAGFAAAVGFAALGFTWLCRGRSRVAAVAVLAMLAVGCAGLGLRFFDSGGTATVALDRQAVEWPGGASVRYLGRVHLVRPSVQSRLAAWEAGLDGFAERPLLGFGPGNYTAVFGLFGSGYAATAEPHDMAHGKLIEVAATTGTAGLAAWLALWGLALAVLLRAARTSAPPERAFRVFAAAALAGHLVQVQFLFDTAAGNLLATLLLGFAVSVESRALPSRWRARLPHGPASLQRRLATLRGRLESRVRTIFGCQPARTSLVAAVPGAVVLGAAAVGLALWGLALNRSIFAAANNRHVAPGSVVASVTGEGIEAFPPLAGFYRKFLFAELTLIWPALRAQDPARAAALLDRTDREAAEAVRSEPWNWRFAHLLARMYRVVADTEPEYEAMAQRHLERARELAPARDVFGAPLESPSGLEVRALPGDRLELRWQPSPGAGYHQIARFAEPGPWRAVLIAYGPAHDTYIAPAGPFRHRIKACRHPLDCSAWEEWR